MQKFKAFSVYDVKSETYSPPFFEKTSGLALRSFTEAIKDPRSALSKYPADFTLFEIGHFDDSSGSLVPHQANIPLGTALEFASKLPSEEYEAWQENEPVLDGDQPAHDLQ